MLRAWQQMRDRDPIGRREDVQAGLDVRHRLETMDCFAFMTIFEKTKTELLAYFLREPHRQFAFILGVELAAKDGHRSMTVLWKAGLDAAHKAPKPPKGTRRHVRLGAGPFMPKTLHRFVDAGKEARDFDNLVRGVVRLDAVLKEDDPSSEDVEEKMDVVLLRVQRLNGVGKSGYFDQHLPRDRLVKFDKFWLFPWTLWFSPMSKGKETIAAFKTIEHEFGTPDNLVQQFTNRFGGLPITLGELRYTVCTIVQDINEKDHVKACRMYLRTGDDESDDESDEQVDESEEVEFHEQVDDSDESGKADEEVESEFHEQVDESDESGKADEEVELHEQVDESHGKADEEVESHEQVDEEDESDEEDDEMTDTTMTNGGEAREPPQSRIMWMLSMEYGFTPVTVVRVA